MNEIILATWVTEDGTKINRSNQHKDMYLVTLPNGTWYSVNSCQDTMMRKHPIFTRSRTARIKK